MKFLKEDKAFKKRYNVKVNQNKNFDLDEAYLDDKEEFYDYQTGNVIDDDIFDTSKSEMSYYTNFLNSEDLAYMQRTKGVTGKIVQMSPNEYFDECAKIFNKPAERLKQSALADEETIEHLKLVLTKYKRKFPITMLNYSIDNKGQEGRHRMVVAGELFGWDHKFPVLCVYDY